jgi:quinol monooxygenase YgiN
MIIRLVTMTFKDENVDPFSSLFNTYKPQIRSSDGCLDLKLIHDLNNPNRISTLSKWTSEKHLNAYRKSDLFGVVWPKTKKLFSEPPTADTFEIINEM